MGRELKEFLPFIQDAANRFYKASYNSFGVPTVTTQPLPYPILDSPIDFDKLQLKFGTNGTYFSGVRSVTNVFEFVGDGADICRYIYNGAGYAAEAYLSILRYDKADGIYKLYYKGRLDFKKKKDVPIKSFSVPCVDNSVWGQLSQNDSVDYQIPCNSQNPVAIPVLFDGITLKAKYTYQFVDTALYIPAVGSPDTQWQVPPVVLVATDGDSAGIIAQSPTYGISLDVDAGSGHTEKLTNPNDPNFIFKTIHATSINVKGAISFLSDSDTFPVGGLLIYFITTFDTFYLPDHRTYIWNKPFAGQTIDGQINNVSFDFNFNLADGEALFLVIEQLDNRARRMYTKFSVTSFYISVLSKADASIAYCLRPLDLFRALVSKATDGNFTCNSNFFAANNTLVSTVGNALRSLANANIVTNFKDAFKSYDVNYWLAFRIILGQLWIEKAETVYDDTTNLFSLGQITDVESVVAEEFLFNKIEVGSPKQDYRHTSGRLEFNATSKFSVKQFNIKKTLNLISPFRKDCYGEEFLRLDYQQEDTHDNTGDDTTFLTDIVNQQSTEGVAVENFVEVEVNNEPLAPIIYTPLNNDTISNPSPRVKGVCQPATVVNIYVDGVFDGTTNSDAAGDWSYDIVAVLDPFIQDVNDGAHTIDATFTDETGTINSVTVIIVSSITPVSIEYPLNNANLYNNKPLIKGFAQTGVSVPVLIDGVLVGTPTGDPSCRWEMQSPVLSNISHVISAGGVISNINVNSFVALPLITSFNEGMEITDNTPLIEGVALPNTLVNIWVNYYPDFPAGSAISNAFGNWSFQLVPIFKTGGVDDLVPLFNGINVISTSLEILSTLINITGFKLNRPAYSSISGVIDNTVFNTRITAMHNLIDRIKYFKSIFFQQPNTVLEFQGSDKNAAFSTTLNGVTVKENDDLSINAYNTPALFIPEYLSFKCVTPFNFNDAIDNFSAGGLVEADYYGFRLYFLPIGEMTVQDIKNDVQKWKLLLSAKTPLLTLLKLSTPGSTFSIMTNTIFRSDYNTLHFVAYDFTPSPKFKVPEIYEDWFENRNERWLNNPSYTQKIQTTEPFIDEIITNGISGSLLLNMYRCSNAKLVATFNYSVVSPSPIPLPEVVWHCPLNLSPYSGDTYFFVLFNNGTPLCMSEKLDVEDEQDDTILIEAWNDKNKTGAMFSTGFKSIIRVEGLVEKYQPSADTIVNEDEVGDFAMLHSVNTRKRTILIGDGRGLPDYLYLKIASALTLDNLYIAGVRYVLAKDAKLDPVEKIDGHPMYYYSVDVVKWQNADGVTFESPSGNIVGGVTLVVDAGAFGMGGGGLIDIDLN